MFSTNAKGQVSTGGELQIDKIVRDRIQNHICLRFGVAKEKRSAAKKLIPLTARFWGKIQWLNGGDMMHASELVKHTGRDMTFVSVCNFGSNTTRSSV